ncbi:MAG: TraB/GumN family protein [Agriterribacter sp.]
MIKYLFLLSIWLCCCTYAFAQKNNTLLWKISGNGLMKPSYLFGTIHLTDDRIFNIGDSLYRAIETSDGLAVEADPEEISAYFIDEVRKQLNDSRKIKEMLSEKKFKQHSKALSKKFNKPADEITSRDILKEKNRWVTESYRNGKMTTFLDAYLFDIARRQGKWTGGIEDIADQKGLPDDIVDESDVEWVAADNESKSKETVEAMIQLYINSDLNGIERFSNFSDSAYRDALLTRRNIKMARRMDSLSSIRSMVFAVGAAHLPGKSGIIQLLTDKGFTVEPVFYSKKIKAADYKVKEQNIPWFNIEDTKGLYTVKMPGKAGDVNMFGVVDMKMYFDIFSSTGYFASAMNTPYGARGIDSISNLMAKSMFDVENFKASKKITINGIEGRELELDNGDGFRRGYILAKGSTIYLAYGHAIKRNIETEGTIAKFLGSFKVFDNPQKNARFLTFTDSALAYSVDLPGKPQPADKLVESFGDRTIKSNMKICIDEQSGTYLFFGVNEAKPGHYLENDSVLFANIKSTVEAKTTKKTIDTTYIKNNNRILEYAGIMQESGLMMKTYYELRGNRWYALVAIYNSSMEPASVQRFFQSFKISEYPEITWKASTTGNGELSSWTPSDWTLYDDSTSTGKSDEATMYTSFDRSRSDSYSVVENTLGKYYWFNEDSLFWKAVVNINTGYNDTLLSKKEVMNGSLKGMELLTQQKGSNNVQRKRIILAGNKLYNIVTVLPLQQIRSENVNRFFDDFRINSTPDEPRFVFRSKAKMLLEDLASTDSATHSAAVEGLSEASFTKQDLPLLHNALLATYTDDGSSYRSTHELITNSINSIGDSTSAQFAFDRYAAANASGKKFMLEIISHYPTKQNYLRLQQLLTSNPTVQPTYSFTDNLIENDSVTATIIEKLLPLMADSNLSGSMIRVFNNLHDSGLVLLDKIKPYLNNLLELGERRYQELKKDPDSYGYGNMDLLKLLGKVNAPATNALLRKWIGLPQFYLANKCVELLLHNKQPVTTSEIYKLAEDRSYRIEIYNTLKEAKKHNIFPKKYLTQKHFAESLVFNFASDDASPSEVAFYSSESSLFGGKKETFYFFKVGYEGDEGKTFYLAIAGPFNTAPTNFDTENAYANILFDKEFDPSEIAAQKKELIESLEKWHNQNDE